MYYDSISPMDCPEKAGGPPPYPLVKNSCSTYHGQGKKHRADTAREESFDGFEAYSQHHRGEVAITQAEIDSLKNPNNPGKSVLTRAEALEDVDLFFRALHCSYGAYHYFGEETFQKAEDAIRSELASYQTTTKDQLISLVYPHLLFIRDAHFRFGTEQNEPAFGDGVHYLYYWGNCRKTARRSCC
mgnify:FL=1